jgi:hypothetical protein
MTNVLERIAQTWDEAYSQGFKCGQDNGFAIGYDAATEALAMEVRGGR